MSHTKVDEDVCCEEDSVYAQSNDDADSDDSSWNDESEVKKKSGANSRSRSKLHKSRRKKSSKKKRHSKKRTATENVSDVEITEKAASTKSDHSRRRRRESDVKTDNLSDEEINSVMSDINPPSLATRSRRRKQFVRQAWKAASSASSAMDSDGKKAKSEPILITLDSDSEDNTSMISSLPSRSARVRGEIMRKLKQMSGIKKNVSKCSDSSTSSDSEKLKIKKSKKNKKSKRSVSREKIKDRCVGKKVEELPISLKKFQEQSTPLEKIEEQPTPPESIDEQSEILNNEVKQLRQIKKSHKRLIINPSHKRHLKIRKIRKRFERQNIERRIIPVRQSRIATRQPTSSLFTRASTSKRVLRNNSHLLVNYQEENEIDLKLERRKRRSLSDQKNNKEEVTENVCKKKGNKISFREVQESSDEKDVKLKSLISSKNSQEIPCKIEKEEKAVDETPEDISGTETNINSENKSTEEKNIDYQEEKNDAKANIEDEELEVKKEMENTKDDEINDKKEIESSTKDEEINDKKEIESSNKDEERNDKIHSVNDDTVTEKNSTPLKKPSKLLKTVGKKKKLKKHILPVQSNMIRRVGRGRPRKIVIPVETNPVQETFNILNIKPQTPFLQSSFCFDVAPKLAKCRECRIAIYKSSKRMYNSYCRFMEYRKLCLNKSGIITIAGFSNPREATHDHMKLWIPQPTDPPKDLNKATAKSLVEHIGDQFCDLIEQERAGIGLHIGLNEVITWKRVVKGVREMCDVCSTTIFNIHWVCPTCGLAVCIDCYKVRKQGEIAPYDDDEQPKDRDEFRWLLCTLRNPHRQDLLVMAQIIPGTVLWLMRDWLHKVRDDHNIPSYCKCKPPEVFTNNLVSNGINKQLMSHVTKTFLYDKYQSIVTDKNVFRYESSYDDLDVEVSGPALKWLDNSSITSEKDSSNVSNSDEYFNSFEDILFLKGKDLLEDSNHTDEKESVDEFPNFSLDDIIASIKNVRKDSKDSSEKSVAKHFSQRYPQPISGRDPLPIRIYTKIESEIAFPSVPHSWFCNGRLLFLHQADHKDNLSLFQEQWKRGQPVLVKSVDENLDMNLWHPDSFCRDFGEEKNDLVDCKTGNVLKNLPMKKFWEGFENFEKRMTDDNGEFLLLKLKDWPPGEDFSEMLPTRFQDLMKGLPLPEYTHRDGILNLAGRLPTTFVRPDLGPKMYNAYGSALYPTKGTTNLHLDVSDAVNVMVYVGIPSDGNAQIHIHEALKAIDEGGCDSLMRARVRGRGCKPGALWHIYNARDADKIRDMLTKIAIEKGEKLEANHDPIHDQSWYIDEELRLRLYREYGVEGYAIAQCLGDAVFIPAGAPHQVRNLHSCVKVAEDFVSPENIAHCFKLTQEFRHLSDTHTNHEDKLQIKNIIYHVVKDALSHLISPSEVKKVNMLQESDNGTTV